MTWFADDVVKVEVRFDGSTWVNLSSPTNYVILSEPLQIERGRDDEFADPMNPGVLELLLVNDDGRFTPDLPSSPYYPHVVPDVAIKVSVYVNGAWQARFYGSVQSWSVRLGDEGGYTSTCAVTATDTLGDFPEYVFRQAADEVVRNTPNVVCHWPLRDSEPPLLAMVGIAEITTNGADGLGTVPTALALDGAGATNPTCSAAAGGLTIYTPDDLPLTSWPARLCLIVSKPTAAATILTLNGSAASNTIMWSPTSGFYCTGPGIVNATGVPSSWPAMLEFNAVTGVGGPATLRCATASGLVGTATVASVPFRRFSINPTLSGGASFSPSHVVVMSGTGTDSDFEALAVGILASRSSGFAPTTAAAWAGGPAILGGTGESLSLPETDGRTAADVIAAMAIGSGARIRDNVDGTVEWIDFCPSGTPVVMPAERVDPTLTWETSTVGWMSDCTVSWPDGTSYTASRPDGRRASYAIEAVRPTAIRSRSYADWLVNTASTKARLSQATYEISSLSDANQAIVAGVKVGDRITIGSLPSAILPASLTLIVEGITDLIGDDGWTVTFKTSPDAYSRLLIWDNAQNWDDGWIWAP